MKIDPHLEALRMQARFAADFDAGDVPKRVLNGALGGAALWYFGAPVQAVAVFLAILGCEVFGLWIRRVAPKQVDDFSVALIAMVHLRIVLAVALFTVMAVLILFQPYQLALVFGLLFLTGTIIHSFVGHALIHALNWFTCLVFGFGMIAFSIAFNTVDYAPASPGQKQLMVLFSIIWVLSMAMTVRRGDGTRHAYAEAISIARERANTLDYFARHDGLTGLLNRRAFDELAIDAVQFGGSAAILLLDLDGFKPINDIHGHAAGDAVLSELGRRLAKLADPYPAARIGGDEFEVLIPSVEDRAPVSTLVEALQDELAHPVIFEGKELFVGASIGCAFQGADTPDYQSLCRKADREMYLVKASRKRRLADIGQAPLGG